MAPGIACSSLPAHWRSTSLVAYCNRCGEGPGLTYPGESAVVDPLGNVLCEAGAGESVIRADVDRRMIDASTAVFDYRREMRPELYCPPDALDSGPGGVDQTSCTSHGRKEATPGTRSFGIHIGDGTPGPLNAITDVAGVRVGHTTLAWRVTDRYGSVQGRCAPASPSSSLTTATSGKSLCSRDLHRLNGNGELTGLEWVHESGTLRGAVGITNSHSVGVVRDALVAAEVESRVPGKLFWSLPVVGETWDGLLNDVNGFHVTAEHAQDALRRASAGVVAEGNVGGGAGMICHDFKGGSGTASRVVADDDGAYTVGVLVQANHRRAARPLAINKEPVGTPDHGPGRPAPRNRRRRGPAPAAPAPSSR